MSAEPLVIAGQGHFFTGLKTHAGPAGTSVYGTHVQYQTPTSVRENLVLVHGGGGQALDMLTTADGRPGWATLFLRDGFAVYTVDRPGLGRSPFHPDIYGAYGPPATYEGFVATFAAPSPPGLPPHTQWPGSGDRDDPALATFLAWQEPFPPDAVRAHEDMRSGAAGLLDRIGPSVLLTHSFGGGFGWLALSERRPLVRAVVAVEPAGPPFVNHPALGSFSHGLTPVPLAFGPGDGEAKLDGVPVAVVSAECSGFEPSCHATAEFLRSCGAAVDEIRLGELGIHGNGHAMMLEKNNAEVAAVITDWIGKHVSLGTQLLEGFSPMSKVMPAAAAVADIEDGASIGIAGFGLSHRYPSTLISALGEKGSRGLTVYCNGLGQPGFPTGHLLADNHQIAHLVTCFSARPGVVSEAEKQIDAGEMTLEMVPQGTLVERMRAGGAGIAAIYTPTGFGSQIASGKDIRYFDGRPYVLERAITTDFAFIRAARADHFGNVVFRGGSQNFNVSFAKAARVTIVEAEEIVPTGSIAPHEVDLPGVFVTRVVPITVAMDVHNLPKRFNRPASSGKEYFGKPALTRAEIGRRTAALLPDGAVVNLGAGLPVQVANYVNDRPVVLHAENGLLNYGGADPSDDFDPDLHDAGGQFVTLRPGTSFFDSVTSFEIARGGRLYAVVLGSYQVGGNGDLANWSAPGMIGGGIGGAMDLAAGARHVFVTLEHTDSRGRPKLVEKCEFPLTAPNCVDAIITDLALLRRPSRADRFTLEEIAAGFTVDEVLSLTGMTVSVADEVRVMQESWT